MNLDEKIFGSPNPTNNSADSEDFVWDEDQFGDQFDDRFDPNQDDDDQIWETRERERGVRRPLM
jgi:hypothetical protein